MLSLVVGISTMIAESVFWRSAWALTPRMEIQDAYKWIYHASNGGEHAIVNREGVTRWMAQEWENLQLQFLPTEPLITPLDPWSRIIRVNLRAARREDLEADHILDWFVDSANHFRANEFGFQLRWQCLGVSLSEEPGAFSFTRSDWAAFDRTAGARGYPAVHHSDAYTRAYQPAYRVGLASMWRL